MEGALFLSKKDRKYAVASSGLLYNKDIYNKDIYNKDIYNKDNGKNRSIQKEEDVWIRIMSLTVIVIR